MAPQRPNSSGEDSWPVNDPTPGVAPNASRGNAQGPWAPRGYGAPPPQPAYTPPYSGQGQHGAYPPPRTPHAGFAPGRGLPEPAHKTASFVVGLLGVLFGPLGLILGPIAIVLANKGRRQVSSGRARADGLLTAGFVLGIVGTCLAVFWALYIVFLMCIFAAVSNLDRNMDRWSRPQSGSNLRLERAYEVSPADRVKYARAMTEIQTLVDQVESYWLIEGKLPNSFNDLKRRGGTIHHRDPWDRFYEYDHDRKRDWFSIRSQGVRLGDKSDDVFYNSDVDRVVSLATGVSSGEDEYEEDTAAEEQDGMEQRARVERVKVWQAMDSQQLLQVYVDLKSRADDGDEEAEIDMEIVQELMQEANRDPQHRTSPRRSAPPQPSDPPQR